MVLLSELPAGLSLILMDEFEAELCSATAMPQRTYLVHYQYSGIQFFCKATQTMPFKIFSCPRLPTISKLQ
jgi:hypothetical protein